MGRLGDEHAVGHPDDASRLAQDDLDLAGIAVVALGELDRLGSRLDPGQVDDRALGLRDDLLRDDQDVVVAQREGAGRGRDRVGDDGREVVAETDLRDAVEGEDRDRRATSADTEALRGGRFDEDQVLGRVEVDG